MNDREDYKKARLLLSHKVRLTIDVDMELRNIHAARLAGVIRDYPEEEEQMWLEGATFDQKILLAALKVPEFLNSLIAREVYFAVGDHCFQHLCKEAELKRDELKKGFFDTLDPESRKVMEEADRSDDWLDFMVNDAINVTVTAVETQSLENGDVHN